MSFVLDVETCFRASAGAFHRSMLKNATFLKIKLTPVDSSARILLMFFAIFDNTKMKANFPKWHFSCYLIRHQAICFAWIGIT